MSLIRQVLALDTSVDLDEELAHRRPEWTVMQARPDSRAGQVLFANLLDALGKQSMSSYRGRAANHSQSIAFAWLAAGPTDHLVVRDAHLLGPKSLRQLCALTSACGVTTWLLDELHTNDARAAARDGLVAHETTVAQLFAERARYPMTAVPDPPTAFAPVPDLHFLGFLTTARELLRPDDFNALLPHYRHALATTRDRLLVSDFATEDQFAHHLHRLGAHTADLNALTVLARGAQAGAFVAGWHARVDVTRFAHRGASQELGITLRPADWKAIDSLLRPADAAACALAALGLSVDEIASIQASGVSDDGRQVTTDDEARDVTGEAQHLLVAQHVHRNLVQPESEQFLATGTKDPRVTPKRVGAILHTVSRDIGVVLRARNSPRSVSDRSRWTHRLGVSLTRLSA